MLQQRIHRERLEELTRFKRLESEKEQMRLAEAEASAKLDQANVLSGSRRRDLEEEEEEDQNLDNLVNLVYKKLVKNKREKAMQKAKQTTKASKEREERELRKSNMAVVEDKDEEDNFIDLIIRERNLLNGRLSEKNSLNCTSFSNGGEDAEESKLIEDLFFLK